MSPCPCWLLSVTELTVLSGRARFEPLPRVPSPAQVIKETRPGLLRLLVRLCAVVGGVFAVTRLLDKLIHGLVTLLLRQQGRKPRRMV